MKIVRQLSNLYSHDISMSTFLLSDPVLRRAQFNQKVINMTQQDEATRARLSKRAVSMETRRFAAIRLAATSTSLSQVIFIHLKFLRISGIKFVERT